MADSFPTYRSNPTLEIIGSQEPPDGAMAVKEDSLNKQSFKESWISIQA